MGVKVGFLVGEEDGLLVGAAVGKSVGLLVGVKVGFLVGEEDGLLVGAAVGKSVGLLVGVKVGFLVGEEDGLLVGAAVGLLVGAAVGLLVGVKVGFLVGEGVGMFVGAGVGFCVGSSVITGRFLMSIMKSLKRAKLSVPNPLVGSQPLVAWNPPLQQTLSAVHRLSPNVMSLMKVDPCPYKIGWIQPTALPPARIRAALTSEIIAATTGHDIEVPPPPSISPPMKKI